MMQGSNTAVRLGSPVMEKRGEVTRCPSMFGAGTPSIRSSTLVTWSMMACAPSVRKSSIDCPGAGAKLGSGQGKSLITPDSGKKIAFPWGMLHEGVVPKAAAMNQTFPVWGAVQFELRNGFS